MSQDIKDLADIAIINGIGDVASELTMKECLLIRENIYRELDLRCLTISAQDPEFYYKTWKDMTEATQIIRDLLPYATASIGLPRPSWPSDSVILQAERFLGGSHA